MTSLTLHYPIKAHTLNVSSFTLDHQLLSLFIPPLLQCSYASFYWPDCAVQRSPPPPPHLLFYVHPPSFLLSLWEAPFPTRPARSAFHRLWEHLQTLDKHSRRPLAATCRVTEPWPELPLSHAGDFDWGRELSEWRRSMCDDKEKATASGVITASH